ncbi:MAG: hypothetical protein KKD44_28320 [Proteobacteria bacterium]|nr:hypothetical protein [Pseudomonadota bacterium]
MADRRISVELSATINLGNYNSVKASAAYAEDIPDGVALDDAYKALWNTCFAEVNRATKAYASKFNSMREDLLCQMK